MRYYDHRFKEPKGTLVLSGDCNCVADAKPDSFSVFTKNRVYHFKALSLAERQSWVVTINRCIDLRKTEWLKGLLPRITKKNELADRARDFLQCVKLTEHKHRKSGDTAYRCFRGKDAVATMIHEELAETAHQAILFGNELIENNVIMSYNNEEPFENSKNLYLLAYPENRGSNEDSVRLASIGTSSPQLAIPKDMLKDRLTQRRQGGSTPSLRKNTTGERPNPIGCDNPILGTPVPRLSRGRARSHTPSRRGAGRTSRGVLSFKTTIPHCVPMIIGEVKKGLEMSKMFHTMLSTLSRSNFKHCEHNLKTLRTTKLADGFGMQAMKSICEKARHTVEDELLTTMSKFGQMEQKLFNPWGDELKRASSAVSLIEKRFKKCADQRNLMVSEFERSFRLCNKTIYKMKKYKQKEVESKGKMGVGAPKTGKWGAMFGGGSSEDKLEETISQLSQQSQDYVQKLAAVNNSVLGFDSVCEQIADELEMLQSSLMTRLQENLQTWSSGEATHRAGTGANLTAVVEEAKVYMCKNDLREFITTAQQIHGYMKKSEQYMYDLPYTIQDIKERNFDRGNSVFHATLAQIMKNQHESEDKDISSLTVPAILLVLISAIQKADGYTSEGIFRISASSQDIDRVKLQVKNGNYDIQEKSPHVPAGLLKFWIRSLAEPVIPSSLYNKAVDLTKSKTDGLTLEDITDFVSLLPKTNCDVIGHISTMCHEIVKYESVNRMNMKNLAIVFAPGLLRYPGDDPQTMLANSKYECSFMVSLLTNFPFDHEFGDGVDKVAE